MFAQELWLVHFNFLSAKTILRFRYLRQVTQKCTRGDAFTEDRASPRVQSGVSQLWCQAGSLMLYLAIANLALCRYALACLCAQCLKRCTSGLFYFLWVLP